MVARCIQHPASGTAVLEARDPDCIGCGGRSAGALGLCKWFRVAAAQRFASSICGIPAMGGGLGAELGATAK